MTNIVLRQVDFVVKASKHDNGNVRLMLEPWTITITRPHIKQFSVTNKYCWLVHYKNLPSLSTELVNAGIVVLLDRFDVVNGENVQLAQYML